MRYTHDGCPEFTFDGVSYTQFNILAFSYLDIDNVNAEFGILTYPHIGMRLYYRCSHGENMPTEWTSVPSLSFLANYLHIIDYGMVKPVTLESGASIGGTITFNKSFSNYPVVIISPFSNYAGYENVIKATIRYNDLTSRKFTYVLQNQSEHTIGVGCHWIAIGT